MHPERFLGPPAVAEQLQDTRELEVRFGIAGVEPDRQRELLSGPLQVAGAYVNVGQPGVRLGNVASAAGLVQLKLDGPFETALCIVETIVVERDQSEGEVRVAFAGHSLDVAVERRPGRLATSPSNRTQNGNIAPTPGNTPESRTDDEEQPNTPCLFTKK